MITFEKLELVKVMIITTGCLLDLNFEKYYKLTAIYLSKQQELDADPKAIQLEI